MDPFLASPHGSALHLFHPVIQLWFQQAFSAPTEAQQNSWPVIAQGKSTLLVAPTGTGKTLAAFLWCIQRLMFDPVPDPKQRCRLIYVSPLKALAVDVERNLQVPLRAISALAQEMGVLHHTPSVAVRTGDTSSKDRAAILRRPPDILITTPESLCLMLTSKTRETLRFVDTVIVDEIHALVPTKRGTHFSLSLERLEHLCQRPLQRIGLSATQRPLEEVARYLGGVLSSGPVPNKDASLLDEHALLREWENSQHLAAFRPVVIVPTTQKKRLDLRMEVVADDLELLLQADRGDAQKPSIWDVIHPTLLKAINAHRTTLIFVNSRRVAERVAGALNEMSGETLVLAHHGSLALKQRQEVEQKLKAGELRALVATSSLELGIDMGSIDLVIQIETPPSIASGVQRVGRANHQVGAVSSGLFIPKHRLDVLGCTAVLQSIYAGETEAIRYPRNCLDVLAQQMVAMVAMEPWSVSDLYEIVRHAAPYASLPRVLFDGVLDMLSGRYPSDEFADLRPRIQWDRSTQTLTARPGAKRILVTNVGTIPDRGLYGAFLAGANGKKGPIRVGELDEEMVHESKVGETFVLGASTWRIQEITHDRVLVSPAPGQPGKMPFWKGDSVGRPVEFGIRIGALVRHCNGLSTDQAKKWLAHLPGLNDKAACNILQLLHDQKKSTAVVPDDRTVVIERYHDPLGDDRICVLTPMGAPVHLPWCMTVAAKLRQIHGVDVETLCADDGFVIRLPGTDSPLDLASFFPHPGEAEALLYEQLGRTPLFAARFRENAGRALLLPKRRPGKRAPLWQQRKRAADLLNVASRYPTFPILLETYRECLRDVFDVPAWLQMLQALQEKKISVSVSDTVVPSPFASALMFSYVGSFLYDTDAPLPEKRAQALLVDPNQLQELFGEVDLRNLLDPQAIRQVIEQLQATDPAFHAKTVDAVHDLLRRVGDLSLHELSERCISEALLDEAIPQLIDQKRIFEIQCQGSARYVAVEDAAWYRDGLGIHLPESIPDAFLLLVQDPILRLIRRYAQTHGPFSLQDLLQRFGLARAQAESALFALQSLGQVQQGKFLTSQVELSYCHVAVLETMRRKSLAVLRKQIRPVSPETFARFLMHWQGIQPEAHPVGHPGQETPLLAPKIHLPFPQTGSNQVIDVVEQLQGMPLLLSAFERDILPARIHGYHASHLDALLQSGEVSWRGVERVGERDGRIVVYSSSDVSNELVPVASSCKDFSFSAFPSIAQRLYEQLLRLGGSFFPALHQACGADSMDDTATALWDLVWRGLIYNDSFHSLRAYLRNRVAGAQHAGTAARLRFRPRRLLIPPHVQGRWVSTWQQEATSDNDTKRAAAWAQQLLLRNGLVASEMLSYERVPGGFASMYPVFKQMEQAGRVQRGYFVSHFGPSQFVLPNALEQLRFIDPSEHTLHSVVLTACDPANPYGASLPWPTVPHASFARVGSAKVILIQGKMIAYLRKKNPNIYLCFPEDSSCFEPYAEVLAVTMAHLAAARPGSQGYATTIEHFQDTPVLDHPLVPFLKKHGYIAIGNTLVYRQVLSDLQPVQSSITYNRFQSIDLLDEKGS